jgi:hypothetical protein
VRVLIVGSITRDTNIFDGIAQHTFGGTALYAARTYKQFGIDVRLVSRLAPDDREPIATQLPGVELIAQPSDVTTTFENSYGKDDERTQRVTAVAVPVDYRAEYFDECDWLHLGPLHPLDLHERWLNDHLSKPAGLDLQGFARRIDGQRVMPDLDPRVVDLLPRLAESFAQRMAHAAEVPAHRADGTAGARLDRNVGDRRRRRRRSAAGRSTRRAVVGRATRRRL